MSSKLREVTEFLQSIESRKPTKSELAEHPLPLYDKFIEVSEPADMESLIRRFAASPAWIIPYNLAAAVTYNEATFSTKLLFLLISLGPADQNYDLLIAYLRAVQHHLQTNPTEASQYGQLVSQVVMEATEYSGPAGALVRSQGFELLLRLIRKNLLLRVFDENSVWRLRELLSATSDVDPTLQRDRDSIIAALPH